MSEDDDGTQVAQLIYEHAKDGPARQSGTCDAIDSKAFQVFSAVAVVIGFGSFSGGHRGQLVVALYAAAGAAFLVTAFFTWRIVRARNFRVTDAADRWWPSHEEVPLALVRSRMLDDLAEASSVNRGLLRDKGEWIKWLLLAAGAEVLLVAAAIAASRL